MCKSLIAEDVTWRLRSSNGSIDIAAIVPGVAHEALLAAGTLSGDPLYRFNERLWSWAALEDWTFEASFDLRRETAERCADVLHLDGVDTAATILLNGKELGRTQSVFMRHDLAIRPGMLQVGPNTLTVTIRSALGYGRNQQAAYPYVVPHTRYYNVWSDENRRAGGLSSRRNFVRKPASDFGWDWGPAFIPSGLIGSSIELRSSTAAPRLASVAIAQRHHSEDGSVAVHVVGWLERTASDDLTRLGARVVLCFPNCTVAPPEARLDGVARLGSSPTDRTTADPATVATAMAKAAAADADATATLLVRSPRLWWPRGYGEASLYELRATLCAHGDRSSVKSLPACSASLDDAFPSSLVGAATAAAGAGPTVVRRIGLRTVELVQRPALPPTLGVRNGTSFYFVINGHPIFAKGSNLIPSHIFASGETLERWRWLLSRAAAANMNMVRVWGGGRYQADHFYELCDEMGLMVWQEGMFACALYPVDPPFLSLIHSEILEQVSRLHHHASVVIFGGNNENEVALNWYPESRAHRDMYVVDYERLYIDTVMPAIALADPEGRPTVDTSPGDALIASEPYTKRWVGSATREKQGADGDVHYYNYEADCEDPTTYPKARFVSEHGFQSFPAFDVYRAVTIEEDWHRDSGFMKFRMRHPDGNAQALAMMARHFKVPSARAPSSSSSSSAQAELFASYLWLTQLQQARCYETAFAHWRRGRGEPANTMGILYWQLNAIWQGPDWSTIEYDGRLRLSHYATARAFAPLLLSTVAAPEPATPHAIVVHLSNDNRRTIDGILTIEVFRWADAPAIAIARLAVDASVPASTSTAIWSGDAMLAKVERPERAFVRLTFAPAKPVDGEAQDAVVTAYHWLVQFKDALLPRAHPRVITAKQDAPTRATLTLATNVTAAFVSVECRTVIGAFSDGALTLLAGTQPTLTFEARDGPFAMADFMAGLKVRSLRETFE